MGLNTEISREVLQLINTQQAWEYRVIPFENNGQGLKVYCEEKNIDRISELEIMLGTDILTEAIPENELSKLLSRFYPKTLGSKSRTRVLTGSDDFLENLISEAKELESSDIHIEAYEERRRVRIRIDGKLVERYVISKDQYPTLINKIKIMANLDIAEKRLPQDGRIFYNQKGHKFDIRVSSLPTLHGEKVVMRLLSNDATDINLDILGFSPLDLENYKEGVRKHNGIVLISGPTGSGKTTTLYATLKLLNEESRNVVTIEDPIEYTLEGINQVQLKESIGLDFASALRTFLRQDPDVIMLGEIRDKETAQMAIRASLTGHLVLSTIHTNSAWDTISRLVDMGVEPYLIASTLRLSVAQRLVRMLCPQCKKSEPFDPALYPKHFNPQQKITEHWIGEGCDYCHQTGYKGRVAIYEVIPINEDFINEIRNNSQNVSELMKQQGIKTLSENAFKLFLNGNTSLEEVYSIL